jgi:lipopolysaccharide transport system permease protein
MQNFSATPLEIPKSFWRNRSLIWVLTKRELLGRYRGSVLGIGWSFLRPLLMLIIYTLVFGSILQTRWENTSSPHSTAEFALILFAGLLVFDLFSEMVNRSPSLILNNPNLVKKVVFPLEILPYITLGVALIHAIVSLVVLLAGEVVFIGTVPWTVCLFPLTLLPLILSSLGMSWILASLGVYLRDVSQLTGTATSALMFLSAVFFPATAVPEGYRFLVDLNPLAWSIENARKVLIFGSVPDFMALTQLTALSLVVAWFGFAWFQKTRKGFADVL